MTLETVSHDSLHRFLFEKLPVQGKLVRLDSSWQAVLERYDYPEPVRGILGETMAATALLASTVEFEGSITLQIQGDGPLSMVVVHCSNSLVLRGLARWQGKLESRDLSELTGDGKLVISIENDADDQRYQGMVPLSGRSVSDCLQEYFERSEQLPTRLWLASSAETAAGLLLQRQPVENEDPDADFWNRVSLLADTVTEDELLTLPVKSLLHRLFNEDDLRLFDRLPVSFRCSCTRERVETMLRTIGADEIRGVVEEQGGVSVRCEFCNKAYEFDQVDAASLFLSDAPVGDQTVH